MPTTISHIDEIGEIVFSKSKRAKRLSITVRPFKPVKVSMPHRLSFKKAKEYLHANISWVRKNVDRVRIVELEHKATLSNEKKIDKNTARKLLTDRLEKLAQENGFEYNRVFIRNQKTLWGSCSEKNNINLNKNLLKLRQDLQDYVLLHELVHTKIKNHSRKFWLELDKYVGNSKSLNKELKRHRPGFL